MNYTSAQVAVMFEISTQTVSVWGREFEGYLSPTAKPGGKRKRLFTEEDLRVIALVAELKKQGRTFDEVKGALANGQRGQPPTLEPGEVQAIISSGADQRLKIELERQQQMLIQAQEALAKAQIQLKEFDSMRIEKARFETQVEGLTDERDRLQAQLKELTGEIKQLSLRAGEEFAKGFQEGWKQRNLTQKDENNERQV